MFPVGIRLPAGVLVAAVFAACGAGGGATPGSAASVSPPTTVEGGPFADRTYRLDLPAGWVVFGSPAYDTAIDETPDVAAWLDALDLAGANAFRAYEPAPEAGGLRLYINPASPWRAGDDHPLRGTIRETLAGVTDEPIGELVPLGTTAKATRFRWTEEMDWGSGAPSARAVVGYEIMGEFDPVYVAWSWPADTDRLAEVEALMETFEVLGNAIASLPPGATIPPSPTPFDKLDPPSEPPATPVPHAVPDLEALLPDRVGDVVLEKRSQTGVDMGLAADDPILAPFGKQPADLETATAMPAEPPLLIVGVTRLRGVPAEDVLAEILAQVPADEATRTSLAGRAATYVTHGAWPVWYVTSGELLFGISGIEEQAAEAAKELP